MPRIGRPPAAWVVTVSNWTDAECEQAPLNQKDFSELAGVSKHAISHAFKNYNFEGTARTKPGTKYLEIVFTRKYLRKRCKAILKEYYNS